MIRMLPTPSFFTVLALLASTALAVAADKPPYKSAGFVKMPASASWAPSPR